MRKILPYSFFFFALLVVLGTRHANAGICTQPFVFSNGTIADAGQVNSDFAALVTCGNNVDHTQIGSLGIYATQMIPTTIAQGVFGGAFGYTFFPNSTAQIPLTVKAPTGQTADIMDAFLNTTKEFWIDSAGLVHFAQAPTFGNGFVQLTPASQQTGTINVSGSVTSGGSFVAGSSSYGATTATVNGSLLATTAQLNGCPATAAGDLCVARSSGSGLIEFGTGAFPQGYIDFGINHASGFSLTNGTAGLWVGGLNVSSLGASAPVVCTDSSKDLTTSGCASSTVSKGSWTCSISSATSCTTTATVASGATCVAGFTSATAFSYTASGPVVPPGGTVTVTVFGNVEVHVSVSGTTATFTVSTGGATTSISPAGNYLCD